MIRMAKVLDINDQDKEGKIKVRIFPEFNDLPEKDLPWAQPMMSSYEEQSLIPVLNSFLYIEINDDWTRFLYIDSVPFIISHYAYNDIKEVLNSISEISSFDYPDPDFRRNPNGFIEFYNKKNKETGFIHPSGTFVVFKENGDYYIKNPDMFEMHFSEGQVEIKNVSSIKLGDSSDSAVLYSPLKDILDSIKSHTHSWSITLGGLPEGYVEGDPVPPNVLMAGPYPVTGSLGTTNNASSGLSNIDTTEIQSELVTLD